MLTAARGLGLAEYDFAVLFDVLASINGLIGSPQVSRGTKALGFEMLQFR